MKIGTVAWGWTLDPLEEPSGDSLHRISSSIAELGFDTIELLGHRSSLKNYYTEQQTASLRRHIEELGLEISGFVSSTQELNHPKESQRLAVVDDFRRAANTAVALGTNHVNLVVPYPSGATMRPNTFRAPSDKFSLGIPADYSWRDDWARYTDSMHRCVETAEKLGLRLSIECFPYTICSTPYAWMKLIEELDSESFGIQLDTAHLMNQKHDVIQAVHMTRDRIFNVHCKDTDGMARGNIPPGSGVIDYTEFIAALRTVGYDGVLSIEVERTANPRRYVRQALIHLKECLAGAY